MTDYWNDPPEECEPPECCNEFMEVDDNGNCHCLTCFKTIECQPDPAEPPFEDFGGME